MGMFDDVNVVIACPDCGKDVTEFQTKDHYCALKLIDPTEIDNFYTSCECGRRIEFNKPPTFTKPRENPFTLDEITELGFKMS